MRVIVLKNSNMAADISNETEIVNCAVKDCLFYFYLQLKLSADFLKLFYSFINVIFNR